MTSTTSDNLNASEHRKREANWNPAQRWRVLQDTITWAESQATVRRNTPKRCLELQEKKLSDHRT